MTAAFAPDAVRALLRRIPSGLRGWWSTQRHWLMVVIPLFIVLWKPLRWCSALWFLPDSQQTYQALIPLGALILGLRARPDLQRIHEELSNLFPDPNSRQRRGNLALVIIAGVLFVVSYLVTMPPLAIFAAILSVVGAAFYVLGPFQIRPLLVPFAFLLLMIPLPVSAVMPLVGNLSRLAALFASQALTALRTPADMIFGRVVIKANNLEIVATPSYSGLLLVATVFFGTLFWVLLQRPPRARAASLLVGALLIPTAVNLSRLVILGRIGATNPVQATQFHSQPLLPSFLLPLLPAFLRSLAMLVPSLIVSVGLLLLLARLLGRRRTQRIVWAEPGPS